ncbi:MAG TPA: efflux RND transporter periplasmic adaptor subunit [Methylophilaceae bacterium]|jgi:membrane fusion protein (multidrug efflux system)
MKTTPRKRISVILFFCLSCLLLSGCNQQTAEQKNKDQANQEASAQEVSFIIAESGALTDFSELPGRLNSYRVAQIRARVPGVIVHQVQGGMDVKKGQLLFSIDPEPLKAAYESAAANLQKSLALQTQVQTKADRFKSLVEFNAVSKQDYIDAIAAAQSANAEVAANQAAVKTAKLNLDYATVTSPISGYMGRPLVTEGDLVGQGEATLLTTVQQLDPIYVDLTQSSNEVLRIRRAMEAGKLKREGRNEARVTLVLDDGSHYPLSGKLLFSDISVDTTTSMVTLRAQFPNPNHLLLPGMYARALVEESDSTQAILLPQRVVIRGENGQASIMIVNKGEVIEERKIKLGEARGDKWVVAEGLVGGERVIVEGLQKIASGAKTKPLPYQSANEESAEKTLEKPAQSTSPVAAATNP